MHPHCLPARWTILPHLKMAAAVLMLAAAGCKPDESIAEKTEPVPVYETPYPAEDVPKTKTILGGIAPAGGNENWIFFKLMGSTAEVEKQRESFFKFIDSLEYRPDDERAPFAWRAPDGWRWKAGNEFRLATFKTGEIDADIPEDPVSAVVGPGAFLVWQAAYDAKYPELSVSKARGTVLANVNRWREQVGLPPVESVDLPRLLSYRNVHQATIMLVEMSGPGTTKTSMPAGMLPPFHPPIK